MVEGAGAKANGGRLWLAEWRRDEREQTLGVDGTAWWRVVEGVCSRACRVHAAMRAAVHTGRTQYTAVVHTGRVHPVGVCTIERAACGEHV